MSTYAILPVKRFERAKQRLGGALSDEEIWSIVIYLRHLPAAGSAGEPEMYNH